MCKDTDFGWDKHSSRENAPKNYTTQLIFTKFVLMSFYDKYPQLKQKQFLFELVSKSVYTTMALEGQTVPMPDIEKIVSSIINKEESKGNQLFFN